MGSVSSVCRCARRIFICSLDMFWRFFAYFKLRILHPAWRCIPWIPGVRILSLVEFLWPRRTRITDEPERSEDKRPERTYSSDEEKADSDEDYRRNGQGESKEEFTGDEYRVDKADEFYCDYDSTWETEESDGNGPQRWKSPHSRRSTNYKFSRFENAARDAWNFRHDYPNLHRTQSFYEEQHDPKPNLSFYLGDTPSLPDGVYIHDFHKEWKGKYAKLEHVHTFIQWMFPLQEPGMNYQAKTLTKQEIQDFLASETAKTNLLKSYELMLDFYGIKLKDQITGEVIRADHWSERFQNLNRHTHNNLRITRILKCLGTLGYRHYQAPLVRFFLEETLVNGELPSVKDSALSYFLFVVLDKQERRKLLRFAYEHYQPQEEFVWCPKKIQMVWSNPRRELDQISYETGWDTSPRQYK